MINCGLVSESDVDSLTARMNSITDLSYRIKLLLLTTIHWEIWLIRVIRLGVRLVALYVIMDDIFFLPLILQAFFVVQNKNIVVPKEIKHPQDSETIYTRHFKYSPVFCSRAFVW